MILFSALQQQTLLLLKVLKRLSLMTRNHFTIPVVTPLVTLSVNIEGKMIIFILVDLNNVK